MCLRNWVKKNKNIYRLKCGKEISSLCFVGILYNLQYTYKSIFSLHLMCTVWCSNCIKISWFHGHHQRHHHYHAILCVCLFVCVLCCAVPGSYIVCSVWPSFQLFHLNKRPADRQNWNFACLLQWIVCVYVYARVRMKTIIYNWINNNNNC